MKLNKDRFNWYGFKHDIVRTKFGDLDGNLDYVGSFCVKGMYRPAAVYYAPNPDTSKGHMNYVLLFKDEMLMTMMVSGMTAEAMQNERYQQGMYCSDCDEVIYSVMRHDMRHCTCARVMVDGGKDYLRSSSYGTPVLIDLLTGNVMKQGGSGAV